MRYTYQLIGRGRDPQRAHETGVLVDNEEPVSVGQRLPVAACLDLYPRHHGLGPQIAQALNHHAALVEVVRWFVRLNGTSDPQGLQELRDLAQQGRALLAQIEEAQR